MQFGSPNMPLGIMPKQPLFGLIYLWDNIPEDLCFVQMQYGKP